MKYTKTRKRNIAAGVKNAWKTNKAFRRRATAWWRDPVRRAETLAKRATPEYKQMLREACAKRDARPEYQKNIYKASHSKSFREASRRNAIRTWKDQEIRSARINNCKATFATPESVAKRSKITKETWAAFPDEKKAAIAEKVWKSSCKRMNGLETAVKELLRGSYLRYVGNNKVWVRGHCPDFINKSRKIIVEAFGDYWHNLEKQRAKDIIKLRDYEDAGYRVLVLWEKEVYTRPAATKRKIVKFLNACA